jgi:hypothetical protein
MNNISARTQGLITGALMIIISVCIYLTQKSFENGLQYIVYCTYVAGILWTLFTFKKRSEAAQGFKAYFAEGFKCFIVVTLLMVLFTLVFILMHPELKEEMAAMIRTEMAGKKDITPTDIENSVASAKKFFLPGYLMGAVLSYLAIGALVTAAASGFLSMKRQ